MNELIQKWTSLPLEDKVDYFIIIIPIVLSVVAIYISVATARKQNRIALFDKRYVAITQINAMITFAAGIRDCDSPNIICGLFDTYFDSNLCSYSGEDRVLNAVAKTRKVRDIVFQSKFLFQSKKTDESITKIVMLFAAVVTDAAANRAVPKKIEEFCQKCDVFYKTEYPKLSKQTHL